MRDHLEAFRRAVRLRDRCREAALADAARLEIPLSAVQANVAYDAMVGIIREALIESPED